jgi:hypothetical protein
MRIRTIEGRDSSDDRAAVPYQLSGDERRNSLSGDGASTITAD